MPGLSGSQDRFIIFSSSRPTAHRPREIVRRDLIAIYGNTGFALFFSSQDHSPHSFKTSFLPQQKSNGQCRVVLKHGSPRVDFPQAQIAAFLLTSSVPLAGLLNSSSLSVPTCIMGMILELTA